MTKLEELIEIIKSDPNYNYYQELELKINQSQEIKQKINNLKKLQQEIVLAKEVGKVNLLSTLNEKYELMLQEIELIPGLLDYLELQQYYNELIQTVKDAVENSVNELLTNKWKIGYLSVKNLTLRRFFTYYR